MPLAARLLLPLSLFGVTACFLANGPNTPEPTPSKTVAVQRGDTLQSTVVMERAAKVFAVEGSLYVAQRPLAESEPFHVLQIGPDGTLTPLPVEGMPVSTRATSPEAQGSEMRAPSALYGSKDGALWLATTNAASSFGGPARVYRLQQDKLHAGADSWACVSGCHDQDSEAAWATRFGTAPFKGSPKFLRLGLEGSGKLLALCNKEEAGCQYYLLPSPLPKTAAAALEKAKPLGIWTSSTELADGSVLLGKSNPGALGVSEMMLVTPKSTRSYALPRAGLTGVQAHTADRMLLRMGERSMLLTGGALQDLPLPTDALPEATYLGADGTLWSVDSSGTFWRQAVGDSWRALGHVASARAGTRLISVTQGSAWALVPAADGGADDQLVRVTLP